MHDFNFNDDEYVFLLLLIRTDGLFSRSVTLVVLVEMRNSFEMDRTLKEKKK